MLHELIGLKNNRLDLGKGDQPKINIDSKDFNVNDLKVDFPSFFSELLDRNSLCLAIKTLSSTTTCS